MKKNLRITDILNCERINPVTTPPAQTATLCDIGMVLASRVTTQLENIMSRSDLTRADKAVIELSLHGGFRISSILRLSAKNVKNDLSIYINQDKGSLSLTYNSVYNRDFWRMVKDYNLSPFYGLSRFYYYRLFIKLGINERFEGNKNHSVTHMGRHVRGLLFKNEPIAADEKKLILGHKNTKNLEYYEKEPSKNQKR